MRSYHKYIFLCLLVTSNIAIAGITFKKSVGDVLGSLPFTVKGEVTNDTCQTNIYPSNLVQLPDVTTGVLIANSNTTGAGVNMSAPFTVQLSNCPVYDSGTITFEFTGYQLQDGGTSNYALLAYSGSSSTAHNVSIEVFRVGSSKALNAATHDIDPIKNGNVFAIQDPIKIDSSGSGSQQYQIGYVVIPELVSKIQPGPMHTTLDYTVFYQ